MKKIVSMILVVALFASLAVVVSAHGPMHKVESFVEHAYLPGLNQVETDLGDKPGEICAALETLNDATAAVRSSSPMTKVMNMTDGVKMEWVSCKEAISMADMQAAAEAWNATADADHQIAHMTVFKQRKLTGTEAGAEADFLLWTVGKKNAAVVLTQTAEGWKVVAVSDKNVDTVHADLTAATGFVVCMAW